MTIEVISLERREGGGWPVGWRRVMTHTHTYSGRSDHGGAVRPPENYQRLGQWLRRLGIDAVGMGSPYSPATVDYFHRYHGDERDAYYLGAPDRQALMQVDQVQQMLAEARAHAPDGALLYLDNETPKGRFGHLWWVGYHYDLPPWHDYDQPFDRWMLFQAPLGDDADEPMPYERRPYLEIVATQRACGALGFWAHPTSWWRDPERRFVTNIASEMPVHAAADGFLDGMVVMGYHPYRPEYQAVWFALLDQGFRVPGVAEMDCGLSDPDSWRREQALVNSVYVPDGQALTLEAIRAQFRLGRLFASSGPFIELRVDGRDMGDATVTTEGRYHVVEITAFPASPGAGAAVAKPVVAVELLGRGGKVLWRSGDLPGGVIRLSVPGFRRRSYLVARVFGGGTHAAAGDHRGVQQCAVSNPVYLHPPGLGFPGSATTRLVLTAAPGSRYRNALVRFEDAAGARLLGQTRLGAGPIVELLPASGRITLVGAHGSNMPTRTIYLANANAKALALQRYLYRGRFLRDFPGRYAGDVPPEAWRLDDFAAALRDVPIEV